LNVYKPHQNPSVVPSNPHSSSGKKNNNDDDDANDNKRLSTAQQRWLGAVDDMEQPTQSSFYSLTESNNNNNNKTGTTKTPAKSAILERAKMQQRKEEKQFEANANASIGSASMSSGSCGEGGRIGRSRRQRTGSMGLDSFRPEERIAEAPNQQQPYPQGSSTDMRPQRPPRRSMDMRPQRPPRRSMDMRPRESRTPPRGRRGTTPPRIRSPTRKNNRSPSRNKSPRRTKGGGKSPLRSRTRSTSMDLRPQQPQRSMDMRPHRSTDMRPRRSMDMRPRRSMDMRPQSPTNGDISRSMNTRPAAGGRYPRTRSIEHVSPGIHLQGNRIYENDDTFRLDARKGITLNLRGRNTGVSNRKTGVSNRNTGVSNHYTMPETRRMRGSTILEESEVFASELNLESSGISSNNDETPDTLTETSMDSEGDEGQFENDKNINRRNLRSSLTKMKQPSEGDFSVQNSATEVPFPHIRPQLMRNQSMLSELSLGELDVKSLDSSKHKTRMSLITPEEIARSSPNHPHPALEYPPLYFLIHRSPFLMNLFKSFIRFRWRVSYPLQRRIPLSRLLRKADIFCTFGELFLILPFFVTLISCTVYSFAYPSVSISGHTARTPLIFAFATAMHNSLLTLLLGLPFERAVFYHKLSARLAFVNGIMHTAVSFFHPNTDIDIQPQQQQNLDHDLVEDVSSTFYSFMGSEPNFGRFLFANSINIGGTGILGFMTLMIITALPFVRRKVFELFYFVHLFCCTAMIGCAFYHTGYLVPLLGSLTWGLDFLIRKVYMALFRYPRKASIRIISESVVEICFPKTPSFHYNPGQYMLLAVPEISFYEWHPFSISSSPEQKIVTFHIRKAGSWTHELYHLADVKNEISILMEGPYGSVGVDVTSERYKMVMLFSGGIGVTPMQALCNQIMYEHSSGLRTMKKLSFIWIERDPNVMQKVDVVRRETINKSTFSRSMRDELSEFGGDEDSENKNLDMEASSKPGVGVVPPSTYSSWHRSIIEDNKDDSSDTQLHPTLVEPQGIASTLLALVPASGVTDEALEREYPIEELDDGEDENDMDYYAEERSTVGSFFHSLVPKMSQHGDSTHCEDIGVIEEEQEAMFDVEGDYNPTEEFDDNTMCQTFLDDAYNDFDDNAPEDALDLQVYLTSRKDVDSATLNLPFVHKGRPDIKEIFRKMRDDAIDRGEERVAVCVCAPKIIVNMCHKACVKYSDRKVCFDFHFEVFD